MLSRTPATTTAPGPVRPSAPPVLADTPASAATPSTRILEHCSSTSSDKAQPYIANPATETTTQQNLGSLGDDPFSSSTHRSALPPLMSKLAALFAEENNILFKQLEVELASKTVQLTLAKTKIQQLEAELVEKGARLAVAETKLVGLEEKLKAEKQEREIDEANMTKLLGKAKIRSRSVQEVLVETEKNQGAFQARLQSLEKKLRDQSTTSQKVIQDLENKLATMTSDRNGARDAVKELQEGVVHRAEFGELSRQVQTLSRMVQTLSTTNETSQDGA